MRCASTEMLDQYVPLVGIPSTLALEDSTAEGQRPEEVMYFATLQAQQVRVCVCVYRYVSVYVYI